MIRSAFVLCLLATATVSPAQFVNPKPADNQAVPGTYVEDPFITEYRQKFFAVFRGDFATFNEAYDEVTQMLVKNPKDARAMVWLGNGQTIKAGLAYTKGQKDEARKLLADSRVTLDNAVALRPKDPNIYMMRAATLFIQGQYFAPDWVPAATWEKLAADCERFAVYFGPEKIKKTSIHLRGEMFGEMGIAYARLGKKDKAKAAFNRVIELNPGTAYERRARKEIALLEPSN